MEKTEAVKLEVVEQNDIVTVAGGVLMEVTHRDGTKETVKVRQIPATRVEEFMTKLADESLSMRIYCDKDEEWVDSLSHESMNAICDKGKEINSFFLSAWCLRRAHWMEMMNVGVIADLQNKIKGLTEVLQSVSSAQKSLTTTDSRRKK